MSEEQMDELSRNSQGLLLLGEIRGQLRELIHTSNGNSSKLDALSLRVSKLEMQTARIEALEALPPRVGALEDHRTRSEGARGVIDTLLKSPLVGWLVAAAGAAWAIVSGKVDL